MKISTPITRKLLAVLTALAMILTMLPAVSLCVFAATFSGTCGENVTWELDTATRTLTIFGSGDMEDYGEGGAPWYEYSWCTVNVVIEDGVTNIGAHAFYWCDNLTGITIPNSVTSIGDYAFYRSGLTSITIPNSVTSIGDSAFYYCGNLTSITIPNSVTSIGNSAFFDCDRLTSIDIPDSVTSIGDYAFSYCRSLTSVTIPNSVTSIGNSAFSRCESLTGVTIPNSVTSIGNSAFSDCGRLTSIDIPDSVTSIGGNAFRSCGLTGITIPDSVKSIGVGAFTDCNDLISINVSADNKQFATVNGVLFNKKLTKIICYPARKRGAFTVPDSVTTIGSNAFYNCIYLTSITIPDGVTSIGDYAFHYCYKLTGITIPDSVKNIGSSAFSGCSGLTSFTIPKGITRIEAGTFFDCEKITSINIPDGVRSIGKNAFYGCESLSSITVSYGVRNINDYAFFNCSSLTEVYYLGSESEWNNIQIGNYNRDLEESNIHFMPVVTHAAMQLSTDGSSMRFIAAVESLDYKDIGFEITVTDIEHGTKTVMISDDRVYSALTFDGVTLTSEDFGIEGGYVYVLMIENIPQSFTVSVRSFAVEPGEDGATRYAATKEYAVTGGHAK